MKAFSIASNPRKLGAKALSLLLALALLAASLPAAALAAPLQATCARNYTVQSGDTLSKISVTFDISVAEIAAANNLTEPYTLYVGQVLCIPGTPTTTTTTTTTTTSGGSEKVSAEFTATTVTIKLSKLQKNDVYRVNMRRVERGGLDHGWTRIGRIRVDKNGAGSDTFKVPKGLRDTSYVEVCVKNLTTNDTQCPRFRK